MATAIKKRGETPAAKKAARAASVLAAEKEKIANYKQTMNYIEEVSKRFNELDPLYRINLFEALGIGSEYFICNKCGKILQREKFYSSTAPGYSTGITSICKDCAADIAMPTVNGTKISPTKETVESALYALNKPFLETIWDSSLLEAANSATGKTKSNVWTSYIKNISMKNYYTLTYRESDNYTGGAYSIESLAKDSLPKDKEIIDQFEKNKEDTLKLLGYLPFDNEKLSDQPFLYSQLIGFLDATPEGNDDMMRVSSIISIVRGFLQQSQIDDMIAQLVQDPKNTQSNIATIKAMQEMKKNIATMITKLAEESCISLKHSKNSTKGENTWTGKIKKIKDLNLRNGQTNGFDMATCRGMQQVQEISDASIMKQLALDDSEWSDMVAELRETSQTLRKERDSYKELNRILLQENLDLKDFLEENNMLPTTDTVNLKDLYSIFRDEDDGITFNDERSETEDEADEPDYSTV